MRKLVQLVLFFLRHSKQARFYRFTIIFCFLASGLVGAAAAGFIPLINQLLKSPGEFSTNLIWAFVALCLFLPLGRFVSAYLMARLTQRTRIEIEMQLCRNVLAAPLRRLEEIGPPRILAVLNQDVPTIIGAVTFLPALLMQFGLILACFIYMSWLSWKLIVPVLIFLVLGSLSYLLPTTVGVNYFRRARELSDQVFEKFRDLTEGIQELKVHRKRRLAFLDGQLEPAARLRARHQLTAQSIFVAARGWGQMLLMALIGALLFTSRSFIGESAREVMTGYVLALLYLLTPIEAVLNTFPALGQANVSAEKVESMGLSLRKEQDTPESSRHQLAAAPFSQRWKRLELKGVSHHYYSDDDQSSFTLGPIDLSIRAGECVFLVGGNGSGKTTLAKILVGLYGPKDGVIRLDGQEVSDNSREDYRQLFSVVFSSPYVFESLLGVAKPQLDDAEAYLRMLQLDRKVQVQEGAFSTVDLSQGQRKRLALFAALLDDRSIYLFDEWAADQDPTFKRFFYHEIIPGLQARGKTILAITHDDRYFEVADRLIKLESGRVDTEVRGESLPDHGISRLPAADKAAKDVKI